VIEAMAYHQPDLTISRPAAYLQGPWASAICLGSFDSLKLAGAVAALGLSVLLLKKQET